MAKKNNDYFELIKKLTFGAAEIEENDGKIVGYATALIDTQARMFKVGTMASITELWVLPEYRKRGIGKALMEEIRIRPY